MASRKRAREEMEAEEHTVAPPVLDRVRNMWEFASLMQYIFFFGKAVKISEDLDVEELETECVKPSPSEKLSQLGLTLLKHVSSHRGLTLDMFDEYTRRQYLAKAPHRNPFGDEEEPRRFADFDVFAKLRVLHQLSTWTLNNADRIRAMMPEQQPEQQTDWRIEPFGWDAQDRTYFVLDDDRLYRMTDPPPATTPKRAKTKANTKKAKAARASKRRKISDSAAGSDIEEDVKEGMQATATGDEGLGGRKWEVVAITLDQYRDFAESIRRSKDERQKDLYERLVDEVLPVIEKRAEEQQRKEARKQRELANMQKLATAKRSSRLADKMEKQKEIEQAREAERKRQADLEMARKEQQRQRKIEEARGSRMLTREQRIKEREVKRILQEEEIARLERESQTAQIGDTRMSERQLKAEMDKRQRELEKLAEYDEWVFDCSVCGMHGQNVDDGSHSIACEKCSVWQHSECHGIKQAEAEREDFHFICADCKHRIEDAKKPKLPSLKFRVSSSMSPHLERTAQPSGSPSATTSIGAHIPRPSYPPPPESNTTMLNGPKLAPSGQNLSAPNTAWVHAGQNEHKAAPDTYRPSSSERLPSAGSLNGYTIPNVYTDPSRAQQLAPQQQDPSIQKVGSPPGMLPQAQVHNPYHYSNGTSASYSPHLPKTSFQQPGTTPHQTMPLTNGHGHHYHNGTTAPSNPPRSPPHIPFTNSFPSTHPRSSHNPFANSFDRQRPSSAYSASDFGSPLKQYSSPLQPPASTPIIPPASAGFSPTKHSPSRPLSSLSVGGTPVIPPVASFSPTMQQERMSPPMKKMTPNRPEGMENGFHPACQP